MNKINTALMAEGLAAYASERHRQNGGHLSQEARTGYIKSILADMARQVGGENGENLIASFEKHLSNDALPQIRQTVRAEILNGLDAYTQLDRDTLEDKFDALELVYWILEDMEEAPCWTSGITEIRTRLQDDIEDIRTAWRNQWPKQPLSLAEYLDVYDPFYPDKTRPYIPEDGAVLRHSTVRLYRNGQQAGVMYLPGHVTPDDIRANDFLKYSFVRDSRLEEMTVGIVHECYGDGTWERDLNEGEIILQSMGGLRNSIAGQEIFHVIHRSELELSPVSELTQRGMSKFFTAAAELAEEYGLEVGEIDPHGYLQLYRNGVWAFSVDESGCGKMSMQEYSPEHAARGVTDRVLFSSDIPDGPPFINRLCELRQKIPEVLYPENYPLAPQETDMTELSQQTFQSM